MHLHWGWLIVIYLFLGGLGAGAYLTSFAANIGWLGDSPALKRAGYYISAPIVAIGTALLVFDLGQGLKKPWLLIGLLSNFKSVMTWGVYILSAFIMIGLAVAFLTFKKKQVAQILVTLGALLALATGAYTGLLIAVVEAIPFWNTYLMPVLFVVSALSTGLSITVLVSHFIEKGLSTDELKVTKIHLGLVGAEIVVIAAFLGTMLSGANGAVGIASANKLLSGSLMIPFWGILIGLGLVIPLILFVSGLKKLSPAGVGGFMPEAVPAVSSVDEAEVHGSNNMLLFADAAVVIGGFALRYVVIFAAIQIWNGTIG